MDRKLRKALTECIRDIETGASDIDGCLERHPEHAAALRPHLELWRGLTTAPKAQPDFGRQQRGQYLMLAALADIERRGEKRMIPFLTPALAKATAAVAAAALLVGGAAGASAALGGPDVAGDVLSSVGITDSDSGINHAPDAAQRGKECASQNAFQGAANAEDGAANADADHGGCSNGEGAAADDHSSGIGNAPDAAQTGKDHADDNAFDGAANAEDRAANGNGATAASDDGPNTAHGGDPDPEDVPPDSTPAPDSDEIPDSVPENVPPDSVPDNAPVPDSVPVGP